MKYRRGWPVAAHRCDGHSTTLVLANRPSEIQKRLAPVPLAKKWFGEVQIRFEHLSPPLDTASTIAFIGSAKIYSETQAWCAGIFQRN